MPRSLTDGALDQATPTEIRDAVLADLAHVAGVGAPLFQCVELTGDVAVLAHLQTRPGPDGFRPFDFDGVPVWKLAGDQRFADVQLNAFMVIDLASLSGRRVASEGWAPFGVHSAACLACEHEGRLVGYVAVLRRGDEPRFSESDLAALGARAPLYLRWIARARALESTHGCHALIALDVLGQPLDWDRPSGELVRDPALVRLLVDLATAWSTPGRRDVAYRHGREIRILELTGPGPAAYCMVLSCTRPAPINDLVLLSPAKREIAALAAAGGTAPEIARAVHRSAETVRTHLKQIYKQLGVASRIELAAKQRELAWLLPPARHD